MGNKKKIKAFILAVFMVIAIFNVYEVNTEAASDNTTWALYYVQGGTSKTVGVYSIVFYPVVAPNVSVIYFKGTMTYNNATRVSMSGTIGINN